MITIDKMTIEEMYDHFDLDIDQKEVDQFEKFFYKLEENNKIIVAFKNALGLTAVKGKEISPRDNKAKEAYIAKQIDGCGSCETLKQ